MDIERICLELMLRKIQYTSIELRKNELEISYCSIQEKQFLKIAKSVLEGYSGDELIQIYRWLDHKLSGSDNKADSHGIFSFIYELGAQFIEMKDGKFLCIEHAASELTLHNLQLLRWRELSVSLGNELFMAALLARNGNGKHNITDWLCTPFPTFSIRYKEKVEMRDMAENHFHLKGSIPVFTLNWVCLMNHIGDIRKTSYLHFDMSLESDFFYEEKQYIKIIEICRQAAFYRMYLHHRMNNNKIFLDSPIYHTMELDEGKLNELQMQINVCRAMNEKLTGSFGEIECLDYAIGNVWEEFNPMVQTDSDAKVSWEIKTAPKDEIAVAGERYFLYRCFRAVFNNEFTYEEKNIFYRYLVIGLRVRAELVQVNGKRGFSNFADYQDRKEDFIEDYPCYQEQIMNLAVKSYSKLQSLSSMEIRITPKDHIETLKKIAHYDCSMEDCDLDYFYVLHFPKKKDTSFVDLKPRNYEVRDYLRGQIEEEYMLLEKELTDYQYLGKIPRVRGYDTCSGEIGCRPEVFGQFYRQLQAYNKRCGLEQVHFTYHVGEDFLDIFSGLRAVDEAVRFCQLPRHSRIGHGMVLGIDVRDYYTLKKNSSVLEKQEILDNVAWILGFCEEYGIVIGNAKKELSVLFSKYLDEIYGIPKRPKLTEEMQDAQLEVAIAKEEDYLESMNYYNAWKLRGDRPEEYLAVGHDIGVDITEECCFREGNKLGEIRNQKVCQKYYRDYHFDSTVRKKGSQVDIWKVSEQYYLLATRIQEELRLILSKKEIAVECNPSSNYFIGPFQRYDEHPMLRMYGKNLSDYPSSRLSVSINTDDQGIFHTSLEMEYAIMYTALSKSRNQQGLSRYSTEEIRKWFKDINEFGKQQVFHFQNRKGN